MSEEGNVNGLSTPALADGEFVDAKSEVSPEVQEKPTVLEIAADLEVKAKAILQQAQEDEDALKERLGKLRAKIEKYRRESLKQLNGK